PASGGTNGRSRRANPAFRITATNRDSGWRASFADARASGELAPNSAVGLEAMRYDLNGSLKPPGSRFFPIGGTFYRTHVRRKGTIRLEVKSDERKDMVEALGAVGPATANQVVLVDVVFPDGKTRRSVETRTRNTGQFTA